MTSLEKKIFEELEPIINGLNISLYDVIYEKEGKDFYLRIFIEKDGGVDISDCENVNNAINDILDEKDFIKGHYYLEVSSAGLEKILRLDKHFENNIGNKIQISLYKPINNSKNVIGILKDYDDEKVIVESDEIIEINKNDISLIKTVFDWDSI
ncbi:MAG: ribosome maturation factor RimP [Clostridiales bacterium]|jgi:ribosome maturation factor rimP|nr:ribosome maturation factor RimP [Clostridiales bacterium]MBF0979507.1 ribosome maturation factor RimP [Clostridiales bacterium]MBF0986270.1 ribosome maturation factor RimP [Clostridiales bacterium]